MLGILHHQSTTQNIAIGNYALNSITAGQTVSDNVAIGYDAGTAITTGDGNVLVGMQAGNVITTGGTNTCIGNEADPSANSGANQTVIGATATGHGDNIVVLGNSSVTAWHPGDDNGVDLGSASYRFANLYVADMQMSNEGTGGNEVDGTEGSWSIQEGEENLYVINRKTGKKFKIKLEEM